MDVAARLADVRSRIADACARGRRRVSDVRIVAVTKTHGAAAALAALAAGADAIGENRVQEAATKRPLVAAPGPWHLIGPLQRNKASAALAVFDVVETVDRTELADRLEHLLGQTGRVLPVLVQVNVSAEPQKHGAEPQAVPDLVEHLLERCPHLDLRGVMTVPRLDPDPEQSRPSFARLNELAMEIEHRFGLRRLERSMGMSGDFEVAVEEGATLVRLGSVLFGARNV